MSIKNDGHYFCRAGGNRPDGLNEPVTIDVVQYHQHQCHRFDDIPLSG
ncbi:copper resistance protein [Shigella flexneri]|nr:copper resistance protein [Shigella flexneri]